MGLPGKPGFFFPTIGPIYLAFFGLHTLRAEKLTTQQQGFFLSGKAIQSNSYLLISSHHQLRHRTLFCS